MKRKLDALEVDTSSSYERTTTLGMITAFDTSLSPSSRTTPHSQISNPGVGDDKFALPSFKVFVDSIAPPTRIPSDIDEQQPVQQQPQSQQQLSEQTFIPPHKRPKYDHTVLSPNSSASGSNYSSPTIIPQQQHRYPSQQHYSSPVSATWSPTPNHPYYIQQPPYSQHYNQSSPQHPKSGTDDRFPPNYHQSHSYPPPSLSNTMAPDTVYYQPPPYPTSSVNNHQHSHHQHQQVSYVQQQQHTTVQHQPLQHQPQTYATSSGNSVNHKFHMHPNAIPAPYSPRSDDDSSGRESPEENSSLDVNVNPQQLQPIRILAYKIGLSKDANKSWRYRDIKRSLFEKISAQHATFIERNLEHSLLKQRLPHKLSMCSFAKRIMLLVYHFIIRDGREPKFWRRNSVKTDLVEQVLQEHDPEFLTKINKAAATEVHSYIASGMTIEAAIQQQQQKQQKTKQL